MSRPSPLVEWRGMVLDSEVGKNPLLVAFVLSTHMNRNGGSCFPSLARIASESRLGRSTVCRALNELEAARLIERVRGGRGRPTRYLATSPATGLPLVPRRARTSPAAAHEDVPEDVHNPSRHSARERGRVPTGRTPGHAHADSSYLNEVNR